MKNLVLTVFSFCAIAGFQSLTHAESHIDASDLPNFAKVNEGLYRGGIPSENGMQQLRDLGIKTILNIENNARHIEQEKKWAEKYKMDFISIPMRWDVSPENERVDEILSHMKNLKKMPVYLHCQHGEDRTGMMMGIYRVEVDGWEPQKAYDEMLEMHFHPLFKGLDNYFWQRVKR